MNRMVKIFLVLNLFLSVILVRSSLFPREIQHEAVESLSGELSHGDWNGGDCRAALWIKQGNLTVPTKALPLGAPIGLLMALGSISFVLALSKLPVGMATGISVTYVLIVLILSWLFLNESMSWMKILGTLLTITGVALISWQQK